MKQSDRDMLIFHMKECVRLSEAQDQMNLVAAHPADRAQIPNTDAETQLMMIQLTAKLLDKEIEYRINEIRKMIVDEIMATEPIANRPDTEVSEILPPSDKIIDDVKAQMGIP